MVNNLIPTNTLPVASQRSRACREIMEERRDITFPVAARLVWDAGPYAFPLGERLE
jgi:hypothetical protein